MRKLEEYKSNKIKKNILENYTTHIVEQMKYVSCKATISYKFFHSKCLTVVLLCTKITPNNKIYIMILKFNNANTLK